MIIRKNINVNFVEKWSIDDENNNHIQYLSSLIRFPFRFSGLFFGQ